MLGCKVCTCSTSKNWNILNELTKTIISESATTFKNGWYSVYAQDLAFWRNFSSMHLPKCIFDVCVLWSFLMSFCACASCSFLHKRTSRCCWRIKYIFYYNSTQKHIASYVWFIISTYIIQCIAFSCTDPVHMYIHSLF